MKKTIITIFTSIALALTIQAQDLNNLTQTIRGVVVDVDSELPIIGANILLLDSEPIQGTNTDVLGVFRIEKVPIGRHSIRVSYLGYESLVIPNVIVNSAKEVVLELSMQESVVEIDEVVILANKRGREALNEMALISAQSISPEETNRYAGGFNDPSRIMSSFAGVTNTQEGSNDIIVRGNAPKYVQWRLEGIEITNPNHFGDQSAVGGSISTLNNNLMAKSDFYTGAFTAEYGDVIAGVYDVKLRAGNNEKFEGVLGFGLLGTDLTFEGPFKKDYGGSYLINYRYSTASLPNDLGIIDVNGIPKFQDAAFKILLPTQKAGTFSIFGLAGLSSFLFEDVKPSIWVTPGNNFMRPDLREDYEKEAFLLNTGLTHTLSLSDNSYLKTTLAYSNEGISDNIFESEVFALFDDKDEFVKDSILNTKLNYTSRIRQSSVRAALTYNHKFSSKSKVQFGSKYGLVSLKNDQSQLRDDARFILTDFDENIATVRNYFSWQYRFRNNLKMVLGLHNMNVLLTDESTLESRLAINWDVTNKHSLSFGVGNHSSMEGVHHYFAKVEQEDGSIVEPNTDLGLLKADHFVLGYNYRLRKNMRLKVEAYYQELSDLPVENDANSLFSTVNEGLDFRFVDLVNEGSGKNYGLEMTLEKYFSNNFYYLLNASLYQSKYTALDGIERNTQYNGDYLVNLLVGKEFDGLGKKENQTLNLNAKVFIGGGRKIIPLLRDAAGALAVDPATDNYWDLSKAYEDDLEDLYQIVISASYKWNRKKTTHELFLTLDNVSNTKGKISEYYDATEPGNIGYVTQFGFFPNLLYRLYF